MSKAKIAGLIIDARSYALRMMSELHNTAAAEHFASALRWINEAHAYYRASNDIGLRLCITNAIAHIRTAQLRAELDARFPIN